MTHAYKRAKIFGHRARPLDREAKVRLTTLARALMRPTQKGKHYGKVTAKAFAVLNALLWQFHNAKSGLCFPSYERIAEFVGCTEATVCAAIKALEAAGLLSWVHRLERRREHGPAGWRVRVLRTSNGYAFNDPRSGRVSSNYKIQSGTTNQVSSFDKTKRREPLLPGLQAALGRLGAAIAAG